MAARSAVPPPVAPPRGRASAANCRHPSPLPTSREGPAPEQAHTICVSFIVLSPFFGASLFRERERRGCARQACMNYAVSWLVPPQGDWARSSLLARHLLQLPRVGAGGARADLWNALAGEQSLFGDLRGALYQCRGVQRRRQPETSTPSSSGTLPRWRRSAHGPVGKSCTPRAR